MISVIIPIYNASATLDRCLQCLGAQTYEDMEFLMVDDGSSDGSAEICRRYVESDSRFRYLYQENAGVSVARNRGIDEARGEYLGFCDADDWVEPDMYECLLKLLNDHEADASICSLYINFEGNASKQLADVSNGTFLTFSAQEAISQMHKGDFFQGHLCNKLIKKSVIGENRLPRGIAIYEDMYFLWDVFLNCEKVVFEGIPKYHYLQNAGSALHRYKETFWTVQDACDGMLAKMEAHFPNQLFLAQKTLLLGNMELAQRLIHAKKLDKESFDAICQKILPCCNPQALDCLPKTERALARAAQKGRLPMILTYRLLSLYKTLKNFGK